LRGSSIEKEEDEAVLTFGVNLFSFVTDDAAK
jgi:hypothetical protein